MSKTMENVFFPVDDGARDKINKREEIDALRKTDNKYEDSAHEIASKEYEFRKLLESTGTDERKIGEVADKISDEVLEKIKAEKVKWIDELTGLRNRNAYREEIEQRLELEKRAGEECSILMVDIDYFKKVNDSYGHSVGDMVLRKVADMIKSSLRASDVVYRYGGEEFAVFLPNTESLEAQQVAEKIRANVESQVIEIIKDSKEKITLRKTISIGVAGTDQLKDWKKYGDGNIKSVLEKIKESADEALYHSKAGDRNRVTLYEEELGGIPKN